MDVELHPQNPANPKRLRDLIIVSAACLLLLLPFINKPVSLDDPLYIWAARQIAVHPLDFYGFQANWEGSLRPMWGFFQNPPLVSFFIATVGRFTGWNLPALHTAFAVIAMLTMIGVYLLAVELCDRPLFATLLALICPAFCVSATSLMCDVPMLCFWTWAVVFWIRGCGRSAMWLPVAGITTAVAILTKYSGMNVIPLLIVYAAMHRATGKNRIIQVLSLLIPVAALYGFERFTSIRYGRGAISNATTFSVDQSIRQHATITLRTLDSFAYLGGGMLAAGIVMIAAMGRMTISIFTGLALLLACVGHLILHHANGWLVYAPIAAAAGIAPVSDGKPVWLFDLQFGVLAAIGIAVVFFCVLNYFRSDTRPIRAQSLFLSLWIAGVFVFAGYLNWKINTRTLLPMLPAVCILAARVISLGRRPVITLSVALSAIGAGIMAVFIVFGDYQIAVANRNAATKLVPPHAKLREHPVWFCGHWGFQYYMQEYGARPLDENATIILPGDLLVVALNNYGSPHLDRLLLVGKLEVDPGIGVTPLSQPLGANFYGSDGNQLPFVFGPVPPEPFVIFKAMPTGRHPVK